MPEPEYLLSLRTLLIHRGLVPISILAFGVAAVLASGQTPHRAADRNEPELARLDQEGEAAIKGKHFEQAEALFLEGARKAEESGDQSRVAEFKRQIGATYELRKDFQTARTYYEDSLVIRERLGQKKEAARLYAGIGYVSALLRDDETSDRRLKQAIEAYQQLGDDRNLGMALQILGQLHARRGEADAGALLERATAIYKALKDDGNVGLSQGMLADLYWRHSEYRNALDQAFQALETSMRIKNEAGSAQAYELLGNIYITIGQPEKALTYFRQTLALREHLGFTEQLAFSYNNIAEVLDETGKAAEALQGFQKALELRRASGVLPAIASTLVNVGVVQLELHDTAAAEKSLLEANDIAEKSGLLPERALAAFHLGLFELSRNHVEQAAAHFQRAYELQEQLKDPHAAVRSLDRLAAIAERRGDLNRAAELYRTLLDRSEELVQQISEPAELSAFRKESASLYPRYARVLLGLGRTSDALLAVERGRGSGLARLAVLARSNFVDLLTPAEAAEWRAATVAFSKSANGLRLTLVSQQTGQTSTTVDRGRAAFFESQGNLERLRDRLFVSSPRLKSAGSIPAVRFEEIAILASRRADTLFLEWAVVDDETTLLFVVGADCLEGHILNVGQSKLRELAKMWRGSLAGLAGRGVRVYTGGDPRRERDSARQLSSALLGSVNETLLNTKWRHLVLVPDGPLLTLPLAALPLDGSDLLIDRLPVTTAVSLTTLARIQPQPRSKGTMYAVGDPLKHGEQRLVPPKGDTYTPLIHAREEVDAIAAMYEKSVSVTGPSANEKVVKSALPRFDILHFATHGILDDSSGLGSGLLLATEPRGSDEDGVLYAWEISEMALSARLAVLSACDTAQGAESSGEGIIGLAWAFQGAGCPNVLASLWSVDDAATSELMKSFYGELRNGRPLDCALRTAMLQLRRSRQYSSPVYWAAFSANRSGRCH